MSAGFTPGPWWFSPHGAHGRVLEVEGLGEVTFPFGYIEAETQTPMFELGTVSGIKRAENTANAHLIAAAPELYEALALLVEPSDGHDKMNLKFALLALAKARGDI